MRNERRLEVLTQGRLTREVRHASRGEVVNGVLHIFEARQLDSGRAAKLLGKCGWIATRSSGDAAGCALGCSCPLVS